jgi:cytochrome b561
MITLSGWIYSTARVGAVEVFGLFYMPAIVGINDQVGRIAKEIHVYSVYLFIAFVILHVLASIYHHFFLKDRTLKRMWY